MTGPLAAVPAAAPTGPDRDAGARGARRATVGAVGWVLTGAVSVQVGAAVAALLSRAPGSPGW